MVARHSARVQRTRRFWFGTLSALLVALLVLWALHPAPRPALERAHHGRKADAVQQQQAPLVAIHTAAADLYPNGREEEEKYAIEDGGRIKQQQAQNSGKEGATEADEQQPQQQEQLPPLRPPDEEQEAAIIDKHCSAVHQTEVAAKVLNGSHPPVMAWGCENEQCKGEFVTRTLAYMRATPRYSSLLTMTPCDVWSAIRGRTLWLAGDSQSMRFYRQLRCFLSGFMEPEPRRRHDAPLTDDMEDQKRIYDAVVKGFDGCCGVAAPMCTTLVGGTRVCHARINKGPHMLHYFKNLDAIGVKQTDIWSFNVGLWHHKKEGEYPGLVKALADYYQQHKSELPVMIWRDNSPQHFDIENGEFPHPSVAWKILGGFKGCKPIQDVELLPDGSLAGTNEHVKAGGWRNQISDAVFKAVGMPIHATWNDTIDMHDGHTSGECSHFCAPGGYNVYIWSLWRLLLSLQQPVGSARPAGQLASASADQPAAAAAAQAAAAEQPAGGAAKHDAQAAGSLGAAARPSPPLSPWDHAVDLHKKANRLLSRRVIWRSATSAYSRCHPDQLQADSLTDKRMEELLRGGGQILWVNVSSVPCRKPDVNGSTGAGCCSKRFSFRYNSTDILVFQQIFRHHYLRALYVLLRDYQPRYILDAGANAGFSTALFKLIFPNATAVSMEPDSLNYAALMRNTEGLTDVHRVKAGLWSRKANITQSFDDGDWGKVFREARPGEPGLPAYGVKDIAAKYNIPAFDFVKIDIEGAEGMVFAPDADTSWIKDTKLISLEVHDFFAKHFGLKAVTGRVNAAFEGLDFGLTADNEHIFYIAPELIPGAKLTLQSR